MFLKINMIFNKSYDLFFYLSVNNLKIIELTMQLVYNIKVDRE